MKRLPEVCRLRIEAGYIGETEFMKSLVDNASIVSSIFHSVVVLLIASIVPGRLHELIAKTIACSKY